MKKIRINKQAIGIFMLTAPFLVFAYVLQGWSGIGVVLTLTAIVAWIFVAVHLALGE